MLRVEASNLPKPRGTLRPRRLLPNPPMPRRVAAASRLEIIPPHDAASAPTTDLALPPPPTRATLMERWSVRLELGDAEIAKLYGQGMTRGAVVWKKGMVEWRPLLITPELSGLLRRTRITVNDVATPAPAATLPLPSFASSPLMGDDLTLPRPARLPHELDPQTPERSPFSTIAPTASDVETPPKARRPLELAAVAVAAFALAWLAHSRMHPAISSNPMAAAFSTPTAAAAACAPSPIATTLFASSSIPTVSIADLPLAGTRGATPTESHGGSSRVGARGSRSGGGSSSGASPSRSELVSALSRVEGAASGCGERGGPVRLVVSFAPSGVARSIQVSGSDLPAATRSCIIGAASRARVPAFTGDPVTVSKTL